MQSTPAEPWGCLHSLHSRDSLSSKDPVTTALPHKSVSSLAIESELSVCKVGKCTEARAAVRRVSKYILDGLISDRKLQSSVKWIVFIVPTVVFIIGSATMRTS